MQNKVMEIVKAICNMKSTDCRSFNKQDLARELMDLANVPKDADIQEIPLDWNNQVVILFLLPDDKNYYSLFSGIGNDGKFYFELSITGTLLDNGYFDFLEEHGQKDQVLPIDYFVKNQETMTLKKILKLGLINDNTEIWIRHPNMHVLAHGNWNQDDILLYLYNELESFVWQDDNNFYVDLKFGNMTRPQEIAKKLNEGGEWIPELCEELCCLADMLDEYKEADEETFEDILYKAAEKLGVEI